MSRLYINTNRDHTKFYVGITTNLANREWHHKKNPIAWVKRNNIYKQIWVSPKAYDTKQALALEFEKTLSMMRRYGINNVRGASFIFPNIEKERAFLVKTICHFGDLCYKCGKGGHYSGVCTQPLSAEEREYVFDKILESANTRTWGGVLRSDSKTVNRLYERDGMLFLNEQEYEKFTKSKD